VQVRAPLFESAPGGNMIDGHARTKVVVTV
jgi:hypothetical protein